MEPWLYKLNAGALSIGECYRLTSPFTFLVILLLRKFAPPQGRIYLPLLHRHMAAERQEITQSILQVLDPPHEILKGMGFSKFCYQKIKKTLDPNYIDGGGVVALAPDGASIGYITHLISRMGNGTQKKTVLGFVTHLLNETVQATGNDRQHMNPPPGSKIKYVNSSNLQEIYHIHQRKISQSRDIRYINSIPEMAAVTDAHAIRVHQYQVETRKLYIPYDPEEFERIKSEANFEP